MKQRAILFLFLVWPVMVGFSGGGNEPVIPGRILGIFGGMGPEATANLYQLIVQLTPAQRDQDHIPTMIFSFPQVPDRTSAIRSGDRSILPYLVQGVRHLERSGASLIVMPCNTAHFFYDEMQAAVQIPIIHMIREAALEVIRLHPQVKTVGLLATSGTIQSGLYEKEFNERGIRIVTPSETVQGDCVMKAIDLIKSGSERKRCCDLLASAGAEVQGKGAEVILLGCTEIPLAFDPGSVRVPVVNATKVLAEAAIREYRSNKTYKTYASRGRFRDYGFEIGVLPVGKWNAITDVPGVRVGHCTLIRDDQVRTGVTAILPHEGNLFREKVPAAVYAGNGFGKLTGVTQIEELGNIESPVILTNTLSVAVGLEGIIDYTLNQVGNEGVRSVNGVVGETNDGFLNDIRGRHVLRQHVLEAIRGASSGPVVEGNVGAGTGTVCFGFKGGIGSSSRRLPETLGGYTVGVLVQTNFGGILTIGGVPVGQKLGKHYLIEELTKKSAGSCMIVVATDAPILSRNLNRLAKRAMMGLARTGGIAANGSGDYIIAFSTAPMVRIEEGTRPRSEPGRELGNDQITPLFLAVIEATEEAILNSLFTANSMSGFGGSRVEALPLEKVLAVLTSSRSE